MKNRYIKFFLGLVFVVMILTVLFSEKKASKVSLKDYKIAFNKIDGVQVGTDVLISGVKVGFVNKVSLDKNYSYKLSSSITDKYSKIILIDAKKNDS